MVQSIKCPTCELEFKQEKRFIEHLHGAHSVFDVQSFFDTTFLNGTRPTCQCSSTCQLETRWIDWKRGYMSKFARGHNARVATAFTDPAVKERIAKRKCENKTSSWNKGLTKEIDERTRQAALKKSKTLRDGYASGKYEKRSQESLAVAGKKISETKKRKFDAGELKTWNDGLTKNDHPSLMSVSKKQIEYHRQREAGRRLSVDDCQSTNFANE